VNCTVCHEALDPVLKEAGTHPTCFPFAELDEGDPFATMLKTQLIDVILRADKRDPRASQQPIGPSELGTVCDRRIGYRIAETPRCNVDFDPWPTIMGTAIHSWLDQAFTDWGGRKWMTETSLQLDPIVQGRADLYNRELETVIDWKGVGADVMRKIKKNGVPIGYQIQTHLYGYGFTLRGLPVRKVCLAFLPRSGWLKDMYLWCADYDQDVAVGSLVRLYDIATQVMELDLSIHVDQWRFIPATPSNDCGWCPWYNPNLETEASDKGCPGR
jgi:hypothetical protein